MTRPYSAEALDFKIGLEAGVIEPSLVIAWADRIITADGYDDDVANLACATTASRQAMARLLQPLIDHDADEWAAVRQTMGRMYQALLHDPSYVHDFAQFLEDLWVRHGYDVPEDMDFIAGIADEFQLAAMGQYGTIEDCTRALIDHLSKFNEAPNVIGN
jgi:hypothetical protein